MIWTPWLITGSYLQHLYYKEPYTDWLLFTPPSTSFYQQQYVPDHCRTAMYCVLNHQCNRWFIKLSFGQPQSSNITKMTKQIISSSKCIQSTHLLIQIHNDSCLMHNNLPIIHFLTRVSSWAQIICPQNDPKFVSLARLETLLRFANTCL